MGYYVEPTANDTIGFYEFFNYVNVVADGLFFPLILLVIWVVIFMGTKQYTTSRAFTVASVVSAILSILLVTMQLIAPKWMYLCFVLAGVGILWLKIEG